MEYHYFDIQNIYNEEIIRDKKSLKNKNEGA